MPNEKEKKKKSHLPVPVPHSISQASSCANIAFLAIWRQAGEKQTGGGVEKMPGTKKRRRIFVWHKMHVLQTLLLVPAPRGPSWNQTCSSLQFGSCCSISFILSAASFSCLLASVALALPFSFVDVITAVAKIYPPLFLPSHFLELQPPPPYSPCLRNPLFFISISGNIYSDVSAVPSSHAPKFLKAVFATVCYSSSKWDAREGLVSDFFIHFWVIGLRESWKRKIST